MKLIYILSVIAAFVLIGFFVLSEQRQEQIVPDKPRVCFGENCFNVEIVDTPAEREIGLMNRESLNEDAGMLFIFESMGYYPFWMKDTLIPLDMIWIDSSGKVVYVYENALPCESDPCEVMSPSGDALYVLEVNGGIASEKGIIVGMQTEFIGI